MRRQKKATRKGPKRQFEACFDGLYAFARTFRDTHGFEQKR